MSGKVARPRVRPAVSAPPKPEATSPGDQIEMRVSMEVPGAKGSGAWVTAGLLSFHREGETTDEASDRVFTFVTETVAALAQEADRS